MRQLTRDEKLRIAAEADRICGVEALPDKRQIDQVDSAMAGNHDNIEWHMVVRGLAAAALSEPVDALTADERATVEEWATQPIGAESISMELADRMGAIIDRLAPKVPA